MTSVLALGKPTVLVLVHGGAMSLGPIKDSAHAIVDCFCTNQTATLLPCHAIPLSASSVVVLLVLLDLLVLLEFPADIKRFCCRQTVVRWRRRPWRMCSLVTTT
eukprot:COSAG04_NODE_12970_length_625_cov_2.017110_1_plen_103_part_10